MNNFSKIITTFTICKFLEEAIKNDNISELFETFKEECDNIGGDSKYFNLIANREIQASRLNEQEGAAPIANTVGSGGIAGMKPEDLAIPVEAQKRHAARNAIFKRRKPNKYFNDESNKY